jgi:hypothetical protein
VNYRRGDTSGYAGRLYDALAGRSPDWQVFMDIDAIEPGADFTEVIDRELDTCDIVIVMIGRQWLEITDAKGRRRLDSPDDLVRLEIEAALQRNIRVIPALVQDAVMPGSEELPASLSALARRHALELSDERWGYDVDRLVHVLEQIVQREAEEREARDRAERERQAADRAERERLEHEAAERDEAERAERERLEREAAEREAREREAREAEERRRAAQEAEERARAERDRLAAERTERERLEREEAEREARERAEREAREAADRKRAEQEAKRAAQEAKERERAEREARKAAERERRARAEEERRAREAAEKEAAEQRRRAAATEVAPARPAAPQARRRRNKMLAIGAVGVLVVGGAAAAIVAVLSSSSSEPTQTTTNTKGPSVVLDVRSFDPPRPIAGKEFVARMRLATGSGSPIQSASIFCDTRLAGQPFPGSSSLSNGRAECRWDIPAAKAGARLKGRVRVLYEGSEVSRPINEKVQSQPAKLTFVGRPTYGKPREGQRFSAAFPVRLVNATPGSTTATCVARISGLAPPRAEATVGAQRVVCSLDLPRGSGGHRLALTVTARAKGSADTTTLRARIASAPTAPPPPPVVTPPPAPPPVVTPPPPPPEPTPTILPP